MKSFKVFIVETIGTDDINAPGFGTMKKEEDLHDPVELGDHLKGSLRNYTSSGYHPINAHHRGLPYPGWVSMPKEDIEKHSGNIDKAIAMHKTKDDAHVWRGLHHDIAKGFKQGEHYIDKGYSSTTLSPDSSVFFGIHDPDTKLTHIAHIKLPKGSNALHLNQQHASNSTREHEVLLPRGSKFKYEGSETVKDKHREGPYSTFMIHHLTHLPEGA